jgi:hypothetical protein
MEELKNLNQVQQLIEELMWLAHAARLWTHIVDSGKLALRGLKKTIDNT